MRVRGARRLLFVVFFLALPLPMLGPWTGVVPPARMAMLFAATAAVAASEGAAGPVPGLLVLFAVHAFAMLAIAWALAWTVARGLAPLSPSARRACALGACALLVGAALAFELYRTPFGRAPSVNLWGALS